MSVFLALCAAAALLVLVVGIVLLLPRRTRRLGRRLSLGGVLVAAVTIAGGMKLDGDEARRLGFADLADRQAATRAGIDDPAVWASTKQSALAAPAPPTPGGTAATPSPEVAAATALADRNRDLARALAEKTAAEDAARRAKEAAAAEEAVLHPRFVRYDRAGDFRHIRMMDAAMEAMRGRLKDPKSADFRNVYLHSSNKGSLVACGEVNARNAFGGYTGYESFIASPVGELAVLAADMKKGEFARSWKQLCQ